MHRKLQGVLLALLLVTPHGSFADPTDLDTTFGNQGRNVLGFYSPGGDMALQPDEKIVSTHFFNGFWVSRFGTDGLLDAAFGGGDGTSESAFPPGEGSAVDVVVQPDGYIVAAGIAYSIASVMGFAVVRYEPDGDLDATFGTGGVTVTEISSGQDRVRAVALQADGKIVLVGDIDVGGQLACATARYESDGTLDATFGTGGIVVTDPGPDNDFLAAAAVQSDGAIIAVGRHNVGLSEQMLVIRYEPDGDLDPTFGTGGIAADPVPGFLSYAQDVAIQPDGKIVLAGAIDYDVAFVRLDDTGALDASFGTNGAVRLDAIASFGNASSVVIQPNGSIVAAGDLFGLDAPSDGIVVRLLADGRIDPTFGTGAAVLDINARENGWSDVALQADGKIVVGGMAEVASMDYRAAIARYEGVGPCEPGPAPDADGDLVCDAGDACRNVAGARDFISGATFDLKKVLDDKPGNDSMRLSALFDLPSPGDFATLNPLAQGARVILYRAEGSPAIDATLPGGTFAGAGTAGWKLNGSGTRWRYVDKTGTPISGITRMDIRDRTKEAPARVEVAVRSKKATYFVRTHHYPLMVTVRLGDASAGDAGLCGEGSFSAPAP